MTSYHRSFLEKLVVTYPDRNFLSSCGTVLVITTVSFLTLHDGTAYQHRYWWWPMSWILQSQNMEKKYILLLFIPTVLWQYETTIWTNCFCLFSSTKTRGIFICVQGVGTGAFFFFLMWVFSMLQTVLGSWPELDECYPHLFLWDPF